ncbi:MAG TPA: hypothetical protein DHN29_17405 [Cytophagales bacterium]|nr:hypothetical protein [Cytophagales bacterium]
MAKISPVSAKYIIQTNINIEGIVDRPDVIGAVFGQTEGLLGSDLELRELQRSGRIGRIEVNTSTSGGRTKGEIIIPSSLDKTETAIVAAAMEVIQRIGPCNAKIQVNKIEDVRISKRNFVVDRAKELLKKLTSETLPDSQEITDEVSQAVRVMEVTSYGRERLAAGPAIDESDEIIVVEGRADVLTLVKAGFKNVIAMNGTSVPQTVKELSKKKDIVAFVDGDRGGNLIIRELLSVADLDFVCKAPDGKEVEELAKKEIHKALRGRIAAEQAKLELKIDSDGALLQKDDRKPARRMQAQRVSNGSPRSQPRPARKVTSTLTDDSKKKLKSTLDDLFGTRGACIFDEKFSILGKVPLTELGATLKSVNQGIYAVVLDGSIDTDLVKLAEQLRIKYLLGSDSQVKESRNVVILQDKTL